MNLAPFAFVLYNEAAVAIAEASANANYPLDVITEVTEERYFDMLECLPPIRWKKEDGVEHFCMCEYNYNTNTSSYAKFGERYFHKNVDLTKAETFFNRAMLEGFING